MRAAAQHMAWFAAAIALAALIFALGHARLPQCTLPAKAHYERLSR